MPAHPTRCGAAPSSAPAATKREPPADLRKLRAALQAAIDGSGAFHQDMASDLGAACFERLLVPCREGMRTALRGVDDRLSHRDTSLGVRTGCVIFDGLRMALRFITLTLTEANEATVLTAAGLAALAGLQAQLEGFAAAAQRELGAAVSLKAAGEALRGSGLEGISGLVEALDSAASVAQDITQGPEDPAATAVASRMRRLEAEVQPLIDAMNPMLTQAWDKTQDNVLWETRMVNVSDVVTQALRDARAEAGGWAICADAAAELRRLGGPASLAVAAAFDAASDRLLEEGLRGGVESLRIVRSALEDPDAEAGDDEALPVLLLRDCPRWLRDFVGVTAVLREAAEHRVPECGGPDAPFVSEAVLCAARCLEAECGSVAASDALQAAGTEFRRALSLARESEDLRQVLNEVDKEVAHVLGKAWVAASFAYPEEDGGPPPSAQVRGADAAAVPGSSDADAAVKCSDIDVGTPLPDQGQGGACCALQ